jgi:histidyl-tRNA synthetase
MSEKKDKKINLQKPSGTIDFLPEEMDKRRWIIRKIEDYFQQFGYQQINIPIYDFYNLYKVKSGEKIINDIFTFYDPPKHRAEVDPELYALRPEYTAPVCRFLITSPLIYRPKPQKLFYIGPCFRYDEPKKGRYRQFTQAGIEMFGADTASADAEIITIAMGLMNKLKLDNFLLRLNDLTFLRTYLIENNLDGEMQNKVFGIIDNTTSLLRKLENGAITELKETDFINDYYAAMLELGIDRDIVETLENLLNLVGNPEEVYSKLKIVFNNNENTLKSIETSKIGSVCELINAAGIKNYVIDCGIARGLDYYTNIVFEIDMPQLGKEKQVCGGGRYNNLVEDYGGNPTPATGFAFGLERLIIALEIQEKIEPKPYRSDVFIASKEQTRGYAMKIAQEIRKEGLRVEVDLMNRSFKSAGKFLNSMNIPYMMFLGPREQESQKFTLKNFQTKDQFTELSLEEVVNKIKEI